MLLENIDREFVAIEYPGLVENQDNMIETLGGLFNISKVSPPIGFVNIFLFGYFCDKFTDILHRQTTNGPSIPTGKSI